MELKSPITNEYFSSFECYAPQSYDSLLHLYEENWPEETAYHGHHNQADKADIASFLDVKITTSECETKHPPCKPCTSPLRLPSPLKDVTTVDSLKRNLPSSPTTSDFCIEAILADKLCTDRQSYDDKENFMADVQEPENVNDVTSPVTSPGSQENPIDVESLHPPDNNKTNHTFEHEHPAQSYIYKSTALTTCIMSNDYHYTTPYGYPRLNRLTHHVATESYPLTNSAVTAKNTVKKTGRGRKKTSCTTSSYIQPNIAPTYSQSTIKYHHSSTKTKKVISTQKKTKSQFKPVDYHQQQKICLIPISPSVVTRNLFPTNVALTSNGVIYHKPAPLVAPKFNLRYYPTASKKQTIVLPNVLYQPPSQQQKNNTVLYYQEPIKQTYTQHWINSHQVSLLSHENIRQTTSNCHQNAQKKPCQQKPKKCRVPNKSTTTRIVPSSSSLSHGVSSLIGNHSEYATPTPTCLIEHRARPPPLSHPKELAYGKCLTNSNKVPLYMNRTNVFQSKPVQNVAENVDEGIYLTMPVLTKQGSSDVGNTAFMNSWETSSERPATTYGAPRTRSCSISKASPCLEDMVMESDFEVFSLFNSKLDKKQYPDSQSEIEAIKRKLMIEFEKSKTLGKKDRKMTPDSKYTGNTLHYSSMIVEGTTEEVIEKQQQSYLTKGKYQAIHESNKVLLTDKEKSAVATTIDASTFKALNQSSAIVGSFSIFSILPILTVFTI